MTKTLYVLVAMVGITATAMFYYDAFSNPEDGSVRVKKGDRAPDFELPSQEGGSVRLSDFMNKKNVVLFFYPKDDTPENVEQACGFRDALPKFASADTVIIGVSTDSIESHRAFAQKFRLNFHLLSDPENSAAQQYGVVGRWLAFRYAKHSTFLIDKSGIIRQIFDHAEASKPNDELLAAIRRLN